ncbi:MAG: Gmad2 immunoglobulin-like domain-containing protein [bacterium]
MKKSIQITSLVAIIIIITVFSVKIFLSDQKYGQVCDNGQWVKYGNYSKEPLIDGCKDRGYDADGKDGRDYDKSNLIRVSSPKSNDIISSPLIVNGEARGIWFFEGSFPVKLFDDNNNLLAIGIARAKGEWMTENFTQFEAEIEFNNLKQGKGVLVLEKDNPSGLPEFDDELKIPIIFGLQ